MTTGVPIYLVSACTTGEEFVAAFRRYADRGSVFVPIAEPIPSGRRGRFALTLSTGVIMVEGEGEVISSAKTASVLHGRIGMTIRFGELDADSKTVLIELEKARLVTKPPAPSIATRTAELPASPRAVPPAPSVRVDAAARLAESVAIGDLDQLASSGPAKIGPKFVMPAVLPVGALRPKTPSTPPEMRPRTPSTPPAIQPKTPTNTGMPPLPRPKAASIPPPMPSLAPLPESKSGPIAAAPPAAPTPAAPPKDLTPKDPIPTPISDGRPIGGFSETMLAVDIADLQLPAQIMQAVTPNLTPTGMNVVEPPTTPTQMAAVEPPPSTQLPAVSSTMTPQGITVVRPPITPTPTEMAAVPPPPNLTNQMPAVDPGAPRPIRDVPTSPSPVRVAAAARREAPTPTPPSRGSASPPPLHRPAPSLPALKPEPPVVAEPHKILMSSPDLDEKTDLTAVPLLPQPADRIGRRTVIGVAVTPEGLPVRPAVMAAKTTPDASRELATASVEVDTATEEPIEQVVEQVPEPVASPLALAAAKMPNVEEATPSGDWTITPGADGPTLEPRAPEANAPKPPRLTGDWTIQLDSDSPDGWSEPSRPDIRRAQTPPVVTMEKPVKAKSENPPELAARSALIIVDAVPQEVAQQPPVISQEPKIQIDPTLMDAPIVTPDPPAAATPPSGAFAPPANYPQPVMARIATPIPGSISSPMGSQRGGLDSMIPTGQMPVATPIPDAAMPTPYPPVRTTTSPAELAAMMTPGSPRQLTDGGVGFFRDSGEIANLAGTGSYATGDSTSLLETQRRRRVIVIVASAGLVAAIGIVLVIALAGGKKSEDPVANPPADAAVGSDQRVVAAPTDARVEAPAPADAAVVAPPNQECFVDITTVPPGADVVLGKEVIGTTPGKLPLPCGVEARLTVRKLKFGNQLRTVMPTEEGAKVRIPLQRLMFNVKVSSQPAGASISVNGATVAMTPTTMKLPAFELSTITLSKDGFGVEIFKVTPKQNNQTVHAKLKRRR